MSSWNAQKLPKGKPASEERRAYERARFAATHVPKPRPPLKFGVTKADTSVYDKARRPKGGDGLKAAYAARRQHFIEKSRRDRAARPEASRAVVWRQKGFPVPTRNRPPVCECCGNPAPKKIALSLDHCHVSGIFRGWLCHKCNTGIGNLGDDVHGLKRAIAYLERAYHG